MPRTLRNSTFSGLGGITKSGSFSRFKNMDVEKEEADVKVNDSRSQPIPLSTPSLFSPRQKVKKSRSEGDILSRVNRKEAKVKKKEYIRIGPNPKIVIECENALPFSLIGYSTTNVPELGMFSSHFKVEKCFDVCSSGEKIKRPIATVGTLEDLVEWCCFFPGTNTVRDLLLGYRILYSPMELLQALINQRAIYKASNRIEDNVEERFYAFLVQWILLWGVDFHDSDTEKKLLKFVSLTYQSYRNAVPYINKLLAEASTTVSGYLWIPGKRRRSSSKLKRRKSALNFSRERRKNIDFTDLLDYDVETLAQQLTLIEADIMQDVSILDFVGKSWLTESRKEASPLVELSEHFNRVSLWVATAIVTCCSQRKRNRMFKKFIRVAKKLFEYRNYSTCCQILSGLENVAVTRLKCRDSLPDILQESFSNLLETLSPLDNYAVYRSLNFITPYIPLLPMWLRDLTYFYEANPDFMDDEEQAINLQKLQQIAKTIYDLNLRNCCKYSFHVDAECKDVILFTLAMAKQSESLYELCLIRHPVNQRSSSTSEVW